MENKLQNILYIVRFPFSYLNVELAISLAVNGSSVVKYPYARIASVYASKASIRLFRL